MHSSVMLIQAVLPPLKTIALASECTQQLHPILLPDGALGSHIGHVASTISTTASALRPQLQPRSKDNLPVGYRRIAAYTQIRIEGQQRLHLLAQGFCFADKVTRAYDGGEILAGFAPYISVYSACHQT